MNFASFFSKNRGKKNSQKQHYFFLSFAVLKQIHQIIIIIIIGVGVFKDKL